MSFYCKQGYLRVFDESVGSAARLVRNTASLYFEQLPQTPQKSISSEMLF